MLDRASQFPGDLSAGPLASETAKPRRAKQKVDALIDLMLDDPDIYRDARILDILRQSARKSIIGRSKGRRLESRPTLYRNLRGPAFPLRIQSRVPPPWRSLTPWMKIQVATLALADRGYMQFTLHLHDELLMELQDKGGDLKDYLRDRIKRRLRDSSIEDPWFFLVMEDRSKSGILETRPHAHGSIEIRPQSLPILRNGEHPVRYRRLIERVGRETAEVIYGRELTRQALRSATGNAGNRDAVVNGLSQARNVWCRMPYHRLFNSQWVDYAFKNSRRLSPSLGDSRLAFSRPLNQEAKRLWRLIREGETAVCLWPE